jgi:hypothetical protein
VSLFPVPYFLFPVPCSLFPVPCSLFPVPYSLFPIPCSLFPVPYSLFPVPYFLFPVSYSLFPIPLLPDPRSIQEVLDRLDEEIESAVRKGSRTAYFAGLYRSVTQRVLDGVRAGRFEDAPRMELLDAVFANRYLTALGAYQRNERASRCWKSAFDASRSKRLTILQHLLLGMNAHINLDLGIAAAQVARGASLPALKRDFEEITKLLGEMLDDVQDRLKEVSPWMGLIDRLGGRSDEQVCSFCLDGSRDVAWRWAEKFSGLEATRLDRGIDHLDRAVCVLAHPIERPSLAVSAALAVVRAREVEDVGVVTRALVV